VSTPLAVTNPLNVATSKVVLVVNARDLLRYAILVTPFIVIIINTTRHL
jgi:hypothetical protein